jgi:hypothetical protein
MNNEKNTTDKNDGKSPKTEDYAARIYRIITENCIAVSRSKLRDHNDDR